MYAVLKLGIGYCILECSSEYSCEFVGSHDKLAQLAWANGAFNRGLADVRDVPCYDFKRFGCTDLA